jgi:peptidyl-prolyl cis-trans isomerase D
MFDLFRSRAKAVRYLLGAVLMVVALSMVVTLIPGFGSGGGSRDQIVAEIGSDVITWREAYLNVQRAIRNKAFPIELKYVYVPQLVDRMIVERALAYQAERLGFQVSDEEVQVGIRSILPQLFQDGKFVGTEIYARFLAEQNLTIPEFEANVRKQMLLVKLQNLVAGSVVVTPAEIELEYRRENEKVKLQYVAISPAKYRPQVTVSAEEIRTYFEKSRDLYRIPPKRSLALLVADEAEVEKRITVPESELRRAYEANKEQFRTPEQVKVRQILLNTTDKPKEEIPKIQAKAEELLKQIKSGADFAALARKFSEHQESASKGGDMGWIARGQAAFESTVFAMKPNQISDVVRTESGFHILQVLAKEEARLKPFEEVKGQLAQERKKQLVVEAMHSLTEQAQEELAKSPQQAEQIARRLGLQFVKAEKVGPGDPVPEIGVNREFEEALAGLQKGQVTQVMQGRGNKLVVAVLTDIFPERPAELSEVESQIKDRLASEKAAQLVEQRAREAAEKAKTFNGDLKKVAQAMGLEVKTTQDFGQDGAADGVGAASQLSDAFRLPVGGVFGPVAIGDQRFICKLESKTAVDMSQLPARRESLVASIKSKKARPREDFFEDALLAALLNEGKVKKHQEVISRLIASFQG